MVLRMRTAGSSRSERSERRRARIGEADRSSIRAPRLKKEGNPTPHRPTQIRRAWVSRSPSVARAMLFGALAEWYCTRLESERPKGLGGSNPSRSATAPQVPDLGGAFVSGGGADRRTPRSERARTFDRPTGDGPGKAGGGIGLSWDQSGCVSWSGSDPAPGDPRRHLDMEPLCRSPTSGNG